MASSRPRDIRIARLPGAGGGQARLRQRRRGSRRERGIGLLFRCRPRAAKRSALRDRNVASIDQLVSSQTQVSPEFCRKYYREHLFFDFGEGEKAGLREFHRRCLLNKLDVTAELRLSLV